MLGHPLGKRYRADGRENFPLTELQVAARDQIASKLHSGDYAVEEVSCPLCRGAQKTCLSEKDTYGLPVRVVACANCGLVYNSPRLTTACLPAFYGEHYRELDRVLLGVQAYFELESRKGERIARFLEQHGLLPRLQGKLVIEIGCGAGGALWHFRQAGYDVLGCDFVPAHLNYGRDRKQLDLHYGSLLEIRQIVAERQARVGLVIYEQVFEHLPDPAAELEMLAEVLEPDSLLFIGVPGLRNIDEQYGSDFLRFLQLPHLVHFDLAHLVALLRANRFDCLAGNEIAQAVFVRSGKDDAGPLPRFEETIDFLSGLERRRRAKVWRAWVHHFPASLARYLRSAIDRSSMPPPVKSRIFGILRRMKRLVRP